MRRTRLTWTVLPLLGLAGFVACGDNTSSSRGPDLVDGGSAGTAAQITTAGDTARGGDGTIGGAGSAPVAPVEGGNAGEGGSAGQLSVEGGDAGEGGSAGQATVEGGSAGEGGNSGEGGSAEPPPVDSATIVELQLDQRPYTECEVYKIGADYARDANGIPLKLYRGTYYTHPVLTAQAGLEWLACYGETNDPWYLEHAIAAGQHLVDTSHDYDGAMFFPYDFDFALHSNNANTLEAPWYSGMAQGQVLSLFSRLGELTSELEWQVAAEATLKSFDAVRGQDEPWIIDIDENNSLWIEEYPDLSELHVLNGFLFAMFGLYDYYAWRGDERSQQLFLQSLHTLRTNVERFRDPGAASAYCLEHRVKSASYHAIHIEQLHAITRMTGDPYFGSVADLFDADYP